MFPDSSYEESVVRLSPGDLVIAYTDGVIEVVNPVGEEWGVQGLLKAAASRVSKCAEDLVRSIFNSMDDFSAGRQMDDTTVVVAQAV
jgi:sigma-B regulation protein RsbU (phosphoserine phosphatase)